MLRRGFTFIELGLVLVFVALSAMIAVPNLSRWQESQRQRVFEDRLLALANEARSRAIETGHVVALGFAKSERLVQLVEEVEDDIEVVRSLPVPPTAEASSFSADKDESPASGWRVPFYPDGSTAGGGIEFVSGQQRFFLAVPSGEGRAMVARGEMPDLSRIKWKAGTYEQR